MSSYRQRGVSLFIVLIILLLSLIVVLGGLAVSDLNESIVGNQSDAQRAYGAAQALLDMAQRDIRLNGRTCNAAALGGKGTNPTVLTGTPSAATPCILRYPRDLLDYMPLVSMLGAGDTCANPITNATFQGICISTSPTSPSFQTATINDGNTGAEQWNNGADYTTYSTLAGTNIADYGSSAAVGSGAAGAISLSLTGNASKGKYWVEIFSYINSSIALGGAQDIAIIPEGTYPFVFRITAMARGLKGGTVSVLRTYYTPYPMTSP